MAFAADRAKVNKDIFTAIPCNKAESLGGVEPLNLSLLAIALFRGLSVAFRFAMKLLSLLPLECLQMKSLRLKSIYDHKKVI